MKILYDDEVTPTGKDACPQIRLEDDGKTIVVIDRAHNKAILTKEEYNRLINAVIQGKVKTI